MFHQSQPFTANSNAFQDVPGTLIDQAVETGVPGRSAWKSVAWQIREIGNLGSMRWQILFSIDGSDWDVLAGVVPNPTQGQVNESDLNPGGRIIFTLEEQNNPDLMAYRFFKVQVLSPANDPAKYAQPLVHIFAR